MFHSHTLSAVFVCFCCLSSQPTDLCPFFLSSMRIINCDSSAVTFTENPAFSSCKTPLKPWICDAKKEKVWPPTPTIHVFKVRCIRFKGTKYNLGQYTIIHEWYKLIEFPNYYHGFIWWEETKKHIPNCKWSPFQRTVVVDFLAWKFYIFEST